MKEVFNDWIFHYCPYSKKWRAATRENQKEIFNNIDSKNVIKSSKMDTLIHLIDLTNGDISKMHKMAK